MSVIRGSVLGAWSLLSLRRFRNGEFYRYPMGEGASGRLIYDDGGLMCAFLMSPEWVAGTAAQSWSTFLAYSGAWDVEGTTVSHRLDACSISDLIGHTLERYISFTAEGHLMLTTDGHVTADGVKSHDELIWVRAAA
ncbi:lipocalin-like domain-containing protein [Sphingobium sp. EM0848]|uniref:lipocalin-like domain-containing protein n=1 Tax=Sphingobium sp. EM0848 TaxID=2743473 RepID=UPI00159CB605|nr:lipocalin-like domain-containing protein [Sphingobium sp. EM0848]